ncbi:MAG: type II CAAX endopeptidase family protein [Truepera sp.]|nr:type II CAAX endopeptidase family protein [Truepera sp.]
MSQDNQPQQPGWLARIVRSPPIRLLLFGGSIATLLELLPPVTDGLTRGLGIGWLSSVIGVVVTILAVHFAYRGITRLLERRSTTELSLAGAPGETGAGVVIGVGLLTVIVGLIAALGYYRVEGIGSWAALATALGIAATSGYTEEVLFRGVIFRIVEEGLGTWLALVISVVLFGLAHLGNPNATLYGAAAIGIEGGMLLGAAYLLTRRLWLPIGLHFGWNFIQAGVFGPNLSGNEVESLLQSRLSGPDLLSGGALGVEGSVFTLTLCLLVSLLLLARARRRDRFIRPFWSRR